MEPAWHIGPSGTEPLDPVLFRLLRHMHEMGTLAQAARAVGLSYRHAWNQIGKWERLLGQPLAKLERGRGASLTAFGERLLRAEQRALEALSSPLAKLSEDLERDLGESSSRAEPKLVIHASHDLALAQLLEVPLIGEDLKLELHFHGSLENLAALARGRCDLAGFHVAEQESPSQFARVLKPGAHKLIGVAVREQGLIVARGNPNAVQSLQDLARPGVRFINRQQGSG
ncbi:MAG TPA: substrate-binding domain-containing protein, partial [Burkholderiales bacterium]|nr:substrate-binding domain-containing protein [Burkholderiales bacterium]